MTYEEWLKKRQEQQTAGNTGGSSDSAEKAATAEPQNTMTYEEWQTARNGGGIEKLWKDSGIEYMNRDFYRYADEMSGGMSTGTLNYDEFTRGANTWRENIRKEREWLNNYASALGDNAAVIGGALDEYERLLNYYDSVYRTRAAYDQGAMTQGSESVAGNAGWIMRTADYATAYNNTVGQVQELSAGNLNAQDRELLGLQLESLERQGNRALEWLVNNRKQLMESGEFEELSNYYGTILQGVAQAQNLLSWYKGENLESIEDPQVQSAFEELAEKQRWLEAYDSNYNQFFGSMMKPSGSGKDNSFDVPMQGMAYTAIGYNDSYREYAALTNEMMQFQHGEAMSTQEQNEYRKRARRLEADAEYSLQWLESNRMRMSQAEYDELRGYYSAQLLQADLLQETINYYAEDMSAAEVASIYANVFAKTEEFAQNFSAGTAPVAELTAAAEQAQAKLEEIDEQLEDLADEIEDATGAAKEALLEQQAQLQQERSALQVQMTTDEEALKVYWGLALTGINNDEAKEIIEIGKEKYERIYGLWEQAVNNSPEATGFEKRYLTFENEKEYENAVENYLVNGVNLHDKTVLPNGRIQATIYIENYTQDLTPARARERENFPLAIDTEHLTDEEKIVFYYLVGAGYDSMAIDYAQSMAIERRKERMQEIEEWAGQNLGTQILALIQQSIMFPMAGRDILTASSNVQDTGLNADPNLGVGAIKDALNSGVTKAWDQWSGTIPNSVPVLGGKGLGSVYQMGVSMGESYGSAAAMGPYSIIFMGLAAASSGYNEAIMNGATPEQALAQGAAQGAAEAIFEKVSVGHWLDGKDYGSIIKNALVQGGIEASEEQLTSIVNEITDRLIMQDKSNFNRSVQEYMRNGYSESEAKEKAWLEVLQNVAYDTFSGFITGGVMGGASSFMGYRASGKEAKQYAALENSEKPEDLLDYYVAEQAAGIQESDSAEQKEAKIAAWLRSGGTYTAEQQQQALTMAMEQLSKAAEQKAQQEAQADSETQVMQEQPVQEAGTAVEPGRAAQNPHYRTETGQRYEIDAEEVLTGIRSAAEERFAALGRNDSEALGQMLAQAVQAGSISSSAIDKLQPTVRENLDAISAALGVEIQYTANKAAARKNVQAAVQQAAENYQAAQNPNITVSERYMEGVRELSDEKLAELIDENTEIRNDTGAVAASRQQAQDILDALYAEQERRYGGKIDEEAASAGTQVRNAEPQRNDRVGTGKQGGAVQERNAAQVEQGRQGANDQGDRSEGVRKKRDLSRYANIAKTRSTRDYLGKAGAEEVTLGEVTEEYWTDEMRQAAEKAEAAGLTVHYVVGSILRANGDRGGGGVYYRGTILASVNDVRFLPEQLVEHEMYHADATQEATEEILAAIRERYTAEEFERIVREYADEYEGIIAEDDVQTLYEEIAADAAGGMNRFADTGKVAESREQAQEIVSRKGREAQRGDRARAPPASPEYKLKFSMASPVEDSGPLTAMHTLNDFNLRAVAAADGIPMASIAIVRESDSGWGNFGAHSILFAKQTVDPQEDERNKVYNQDAWTPVYKSDLYDEFSRDTEAALNGIVQTELQNLKSGKDFQKAQRTFNNYVGEEKISDEDFAWAATKAKEIVSRDFGWASYGESERRAIDSIIKAWETTAEKDRTRLLIHAQPILSDAAFEHERLRGEEIYEEFPTIEAMMGDFGFYGDRYTSDPMKALFGQSWHEVLAKTIIGDVSKPSLRKAMNAIEELERNYKRWRMGRGLTEKYDAALDKATRQRDQQWFDLIEENRANYGPDVVATMMAQPPIRDDIMDTRNVQVVESVKQMHQNANWAREYMEGKPARFIEGGEIKGVVYADDIGAEALKALKKMATKHGFPIAKYKAGDENSRAKQVNRLANEGEIKFSAASEAERPWEIVSDHTHSSAQEMGYPVLEGEQVIPFKTWVKATDLRTDGKPWNNYGLVIANSVTTRQLGVSFWSKDESAGIRKGAYTEFKWIDYKYLHPVQGEYQMTREEYNSLMESVPEEVAREQIDFMGDNAAEFSKMYEEILWQREQQRLRDEENGLKLDEAPEGFPWSKKNPLRSSGTRLSPREAAKYLAGATGKEWNIIQDPRRGTWKAVPSARPAGVAKDSEYNRLVKEAKETGATPMSWKEFSWQKLQEKSIKYGEETSTRPVRPEGIAREEFQGTQALRDLGIRISGSVVDYSDTATMRERELALRKMHKAIKKMERALRKNEGAAQLGSRTIAMAEDLVEGKIFPEDIPKTLDRRDVIKLAELKMDYKLLGEDLSKKRKLAINRGLVEKAMEMLPDAKELAEDPEAVKAVSLLLLNYGTPEDNMYQIFGDKNGRAEKLYDYYFRTVEENEAEKMRWMNRMFDEASAFRDSKGKQSRLNKAESAYVHVLLDMEGVVQNVENSKRAKEIKALAEATNAKNTEEAEKIGATLTAVEKEWAEQYARFVAEQAAAKDNKKIDQTKCENAAQHYRETFEKLYQALTDLMVTHGLTPLGHIDYYAPHLTINEKSNIMAGFFQELGLKSADGDINEIPADIAGRTQEFKPTKRWTPFLLKRKGTATDYDIVTAYETYLTYVADVLYHHDDILKLRGLETMLRNTANAEWQEQMKELLRVSAYGDINDKVELLQQMGVIDQDYEGEMSPEELLQWLDKNASVEEKHKYLVELGQLMPEEVVTEEQVHALFSELGTKQDEAFAAAVQGLLEDYGLIDSENRVTAAEATDKLNELYEAMASENRRSEAVRYSSLVNWITNYTNILAGKQYGGDRGAEYNGGRRMVKALSNTVRRYGTAKVVGNLSSVLSQVSQVPLIMAETSAKSQIMALRDIMAQITKENWVQMRGWGDQVDLLTGKKGVQYINEGVLEKVTGTMVKPMELMDRFVSLYAARAAYYDALSGKVRGIAAEDQAAATRYANDFARRIMASRAKGSKPAAFHSKGFFSTMLNMFQVEQLNTVRHMLHDMPREMRRDIREYGVKKGVARYASRMLVYMLAAFLLNRGLDELYGQTPIPFDVPGYILQFIAAGYGVTANDLLTGQGELKDEFQWGDAGEELLYELGGDVPFANNVLGILGMGDQKMPMPDVSTIVDVFQSVWKAMTDEGVSGWVAAEAAAKALAEFIPGGSQIKKTVGGISALSRGGTYTDDGRLKWAVDNDPWSVIQNILFGTSSTDEAQRYYARGYGAVSENMTEAYKLLTEQGIDPNDAYDAVYGVKMAWDANEDLSYEEKKQLQRDAIQDSSLDDADKLLLWTYAFGYKDDETGEIVNKDAETFLQLMEADMSWDDIMEMYNYRQELEEDDTLDDEAADLQFAHWVETHGYTKKQKAVIVDAYASGEDRYFKLADCGISASNAKALEEAFTAFSDSLEEGKSITTTDKAKIVIGMGMSDADEYSALAAILKSGTLDRLTVATNAGISCSTWIEYWTATAQMKNIKDDNDEVVVKKRDQVLEYIDGLPLTPEQKDVLYYDQGYAESKIGEAPWN